MQLTKLDDAKEYSTVGHFGMKALRLHGKDTSDCENFILGMSEFLPGGGTDFMEGGVELIYIVVEGEMTVRAGDQVYKMGKYDSMHFSKGEAKSIKNETNMPAMMLVIAATPK